jgi:DNA-binding winged helix-turn-helix (wHTH) protein
LVGLSTSATQSLLYLLAARAGQVVTLDEILDAFWGVDYLSGNNVVDGHIRGLRAKLQNDWRKPRFIETVPGKGYRFLPVFAESRSTSSPLTRRCCVADGALSSLSMTKPSGRGGPACHDGTLMTIGLSGVTMVG